MKKVLGLLIIFMLLLCMGCSETTEELTTNEYSHLNIDYDTFSVINQNKEAVDLLGFQFMYFISETFVTFSGSKTTSSKLLNIETGEIIDIHEYFGLDVSEYYGSGGGNGVYYFEKGNKFIIIHDDVLSYLEFEDSDYDYRFSCYDEEYYMISKYNQGIRNIEIRTIDGNNIVAEIENASYYNKDLFISYENENKTTFYQFINHSFNKILELDYEIDRIGYSPSGDGNIIVNFTLEDNLNKFLFFEYDDEGMLQLMDQISDSNLLEIVELNDLFIFDYGLYYEVYDFNLNSLVKLQRDILNLDGVYPINGTYYMEINVDVLNIYTYHNELVAEIETTELDNYQSILAGSSDSTYYISTRDHLYIFDVLDESITETVIKSGFFNNVLDVIYEDGQLTVSKTISDETTYYELHGLKEILSEIPVEIDSISGSLYKNSDYISCSISGENYTGEDFFLFKDGELIIKGYLVGISILGIDNGYAFLLRNQDYSLMYFKSSNLV